MTASVLGYFPPRPGPWERRAPDSLGLDTQVLRDAVAFAGSHDMPWPGDLAKVNVSNDRPPYDRKLGPFKPRGRPTGLVIKDGYVAAEWGTPDRVDVTYSASKSYVSAVAGVAITRGLIASLDDRVRDYLGNAAKELGNGAAADRTRTFIESFDSQQNRNVTWRHFLTQTSEWEGSIGGISDLADWNRGVTGLDLPGRDLRKAPGEHFEYNDVRVNAAAMALLLVFRKPLPEVLKRDIMDPIGASGTWEWHGYGQHTTIQVGPRAIESVAGGAHWGGGVHINAYDHARFGLLFLNRGTWQGWSLVSESFFREMSTPGRLNKSYGLMWWLNTGHTRYGSAPESVFAASGAGGNSVVCDPVNRMVTVTRWCSDVPQLVEMVSASVK